MAKKACAGVLKIGGTPTIIGELRSWSIDDNADEIDVSVMGNCARTRIGGAREGTINFSYYIEHADAGQALIIPGTEGVDVELYPRGETTGLSLITFTGNIISANQSGDVNGAIEGSAVMSADDNGITYGTVP